MLAIFSEEKFITFLNKKKKEKGITNLDHAGLQVCLSKTWMVLMPIHPSNYYWTPIY